MPAKKATRAVKPTIDAPAQAINTRLWLMVAKARQQSFPDIRLSVAVGIFQINNLRSVAYDYALSPGLNIEGKSQLVLEHNGLVEATVVVLIKQHFDRAALFAFIGNIV